MIYNPYELLFRKKNADTRGFLLYALFMDEMDYRILEILQKDGRASHEAIGRQVHLSRPAVRSRILSMEEQGIIQGYSTQIDYSRLGYPIHVLIYLKVSDATYRQIQDQLDQLQDPDIKRYSCYRISGEWCFLLKVMSRSQEGLTRYLDMLLDIEGIVSTNTVFLFTS